MSCKRQVRHCGFRPGRRSAGGKCCPAPRRHWRVCQPVPHIIALPVEFFALQNRVENPEIGCRIRAAPGNPLPAGGVRTDVCINQRVPEPLFAKLPGNTQVLDQERSHDHADPVVHPPGCPQFPHACIDDGKSGHPALPAVEFPSVLAPWKVAKFRLERIGWQARPVVQKVV